jgi:hypothetical protein
MQSPPVPARACPVAAAQAAASQEKNPAAFHKIKCLALHRSLFYYCVLQSSTSDYYARRNEVIKVNQEELTQKIQKLKQTAAEKKAKAGSKKSDPEVRAACKKVKRAQRKLRSAKAYKAAGKKPEAKAEEKAS